MLETMYHKASSIFFVAKSGHIMFMLNRLRYGIRLVNPMLEDLKSKYPLAYQLAGIAAAAI